MAKDKMYQAMKEIAKSKGIKASPEHDLYIMCPSCFLNAFYCEIADKKTKKLNMHIQYQAKCPYFDELNLFIVNPDLDVKFSDKVRANSSVSFTSCLFKEIIEYALPGTDESYAVIAEKTFERIENRYKVFLTEVNDRYGDLEQYFISNQDKFPLQAAFVYIHQKNYDQAEECLQKMPDKLDLSFFPDPETKEQKMRLKASNAKDLGNCFERDHMDCYRDYVTAKKNGLEWTHERARYGLLKEERLP